MKSDTTAASGPLWTYDSLSALPANTYRKLLVVNNTAGKKCAGILWDTARSPDVVPPHAVKVKTSDNKNYYLQG